MCPAASNPCSRRGVCDADTGECFCDPGYGGSRCESVGTVGSCACGVAHTHVNADGTRQSTCSGRLDSNGACVCLEGWAGANCADACPGAGVVGAEVCGGHGSCNPATGTCDCDPCYSRDLSDACVQDACATCDAERGVCSCVGGSMTCACRGQFDGYACDQCKCGANGRCNALSGECECDAGYGGELPRPGQSSCRRPPVRTAVRGTPRSVDASAVTRGRAACSATSTAIRTSNAAVTGRATPTVRARVSRIRRLEQLRRVRLGIRPVPGVRKDARRRRVLGRVGRRLRRDDQFDDFGQTVSIVVLADARPRTTYDASSSGSTTNECRNPSGTAAHPWCYVDTNALTGPGTYERNQPLWEFCSVPVCKPSSYTGRPRCAASLAPESVTPFALNATGRRNAVSQVALTTTSGSLDKSGCAGAIDLTNSDVVLHGNFVARFKETRAPGTRAASSNTSASRRRRRRRRRTTASR